ncbi:MAG: hypothetical protein MJY60_04975 [Bacteroidales bacterium]|nr:hypothetical protein [Bacteroidales bacterium]
MKINSKSILLLAAVLTMMPACSPKAASTVAADAQDATPAVETPYVSVRTDVPNKAFYKDVFMHGGLSLSSYDSLPFLGALGLSHEYVALGSATEENKELQKSIFNSNPDDANGVLLYPDGEPRFRLLYVNGGGANSSGKRLEEQGRLNFKAFVDNGGSYVGNCAGAYLPAVTEDRTGFGGYVGVWPGDCSGASTPVWNVGYIVPEGSPLRKYSDFGGDYYIDSVKHHNGPFFERWYEVPGTEVLTINDYPAYRFHMQPSAIAYKADCYKGRIVPIGGHPEKIEEGEKYILMQSYVRYALEGQGCAKAKGILSNGEMRRMTKSTEDNDPAHTKIGDKQCHHFVFALPKKARNIEIRLESLENYELSLRLAQGTFAFKEDAKYAAEGKELVKTLKFDELPAGTWYIGVQCESTVEATPTKTHVAYNNTAILNGAPYTISVKWDNIGTGKAVLANGANANETIKKMLKPKAIFTDIDSTITKIVFKTSVAAPAGVRIDDPALSEEPICASIDKDVLTISTTAAEINSGLHPSFFFQGYGALRTIENIEALNTSEALSFTELFKDCRSIEKIDLSSFEAGSLHSIDGMFHNCASLRKVDFSPLKTVRPIKLGDAFRGMPNLEEIDFGMMEFNDYEIYDNIYLFSSKKDAGNKRCSSIPGKLTIRCTQSVAAKMFANGSLQNLSFGAENAEPVKIIFIDSATGKEIKAEWTEVTRY